MASTGWVIVSCPFLASSLFEQTGGATSSQINGLDSQAGAGRPQMCIGESFLTLQLQSLTVESNTVISKIEGVKTSRQFWRDILIPDQKDTYVGRMKGKTGQWVEFDKQTITPGVSRSQD